MKKKLISILLISTLLISTLLISTFISCDKNDPGNLQYVTTIQGGCFLDKGTLFKGDPLIKPDTVTYSVTNDSLNIFVGFNDTCCSDYSTSSAIKGDSIIIKILTTQIGECNCICYYTYNFIFSGNAALYKYHVSGPNLNIMGRINP